MAGSNTKARKKMFQTTGKKTVAKGIETSSEVYSEGHTVVPSSITNLKPNEPDETIRDCFTMPAFDYDLIEPIKRKCLQAGVVVNKSEILRAGLKALTAMAEKDLLKIVGSLVRLKPGRPRS
jgi:hypothetical protein